MAESGKQFRNVALFDRQRIFDLNSFSPPTSAPSILPSTPMASSRRPIFISQRGLSTAGMIITPNRSALKAV